MTKRVGNTVYLQETPPKKCELCGKIAELRPYGPNGENVCFECGMKDEAAAKKAFSTILDGAEEVVVLPPEIETQQ